MSIKYIFFENRDRNIKTISNEIRFNLIRVHNYIGALPHLDENNYEYSDYMIDYCYECDQTIASPFCDIMLRFEGTAEYCGDNLEQLLKMLIKLSHELQNEMNKLK